MTVPSASAALPEKIGKYKVVRVLGRGSMGVVYLARDPLIDRDVAIKTILLPDGLQDYQVREFRERFIREARAAGRLNHASIVTIYEADDGSSGGPPFIAMEYVEGLPWNLKIRQKLPPDPDAVLPMVRDIASALYYAHRTGVVHRDIKPANIVQTPSGHVKLMDFGIAKVPTSELTKEGQFLGTPAYMSPEQVQGKAVDGRSDLFSLGTALYELLTSQKPFPGEEITTVTYKILKEEPPRASSLNPAIPPPVDQILEKLLAKEPSERYGDARQLMEDIDAYMGGAALPHAGSAGKPAPPPVQPPSAAENTVAAALPPAPEDARTPAPRPALARPRGVRPVFLIGGLTAALVLAVGLALGGYLWFRSAPPQHDQTPPEEQAVPAPVTTDTAAAAPPPESPAPAPSTAREPAAAAKVSPSQAARTREPKGPPQPPPDVLAAAQAIRKAEAAERAKREQPVAAPAPLPATVTYAFSSHILKGEFWIRVDGKEVAHQVVRRKFSFKGETFTGAFPVPPGPHQVSFEVRTEVQDIKESHGESVTFQPGQKRGLLIVMTKFNKDIRFEWGEPGSETHEP